MVADNRGEASERAMAAARVVGASWEGSAAMLASSALVEHSPVSMLVVDSAGIIAGANGEARALLGYEAGELDGAALELLIPPQQRQAHAALMTAYTTNPKGRPMIGRRDLAVWTRDEREVPVQIGLAPVRTHDGLAFIASLLDISVRKRIELASAAHTAFFRAASAARSASDVLQAALEVVGGALCWDSAFFWETGDPTRPMPQAAVWRAGMSMILGAGSRPLRYGVGAAGRAWATRETVWLEHRPRADAGSDLQTEADWRVVVAVPVVRGDTVTGVLQYGSRQPRGIDDLVVETLFSVATTLGQVLDRIAAEDAARRERARAIAMAQRAQALAEKLALYVSPHLIGGLVSGAVDAQVQTRRRLLTVFFSDIVNFTRHTAILAPEVMSELLNQYFRTMTEIISEHGGTLDKFIGDALMVFFGDPDTAGGEEDAARCMAMAEAMQRALIDLRPLWLARGVADPLQVRMGVATGYCAVGNFGSGTRLEYTAIGAPVNLAARLESAARPGRVLVSESTYGLLCSRRTFVQAPASRLKGFSEDLRAYELCMSDCPGVFVYDAVGAKISVDFSQLSGAERARLRETLHGLSREVDG